MIHVEWIIIYYLEFLDPHKKTSEYSRPSYNNIIYAGDAHIATYMLKLRALGFTVDYTKHATTKYNFQCIDIYGMKQPMFHQRYK